MKFLIKIVTTHSTDTAYKVSGVLAMVSDEDAEWVWMLSG